MSEVYRVTFIPSKRLRHWMAAAALMLMSTFTLADCELKVGWEPWKPYSYLDDDGALTGLDVVLVRAMAAKAGCEVSFERMPWGRLLESLRSGRDLQVVTGASRLPEREAYAWFSEPYRDETMQLFMRREDLARYDFTRFEDMIGSGFRLGTARNFFYGDAFLEVIENPQFRGLMEEVNTDLQNILKLEAGRIDGFLADQFVAARLIREHGPTGWIQAHPMAVNSDHIHLMFSKNAVQKDTVQKFNEALEALKRSGEYDQILSSYLN